MHERENAKIAPILLLDLLKLGNRRFTCGAYSGVDLTILEQLAQRLVARVPVIETDFGVGKALGWPWACGVSIAPSTHCTRDRSTPCYFSSPRIYAAAVMV